MPLALPVLSQPYFSFSLRDECLCIHCVFHPWLGRVAGVADLSSTHPFQRSVLMQLTSWLTSIQDTFTRRNLSRKRGGRNGVSGAVRSTWPGRPNCSSFGRCSRPSHLIPVTSRSTSTAAIPRQLRSRVRTKSRSRSTAPRSTRCRTLRPSTPSLSLQVMAATSSTCRVSSPSTSLTCQSLQRSRPVPETTQSPARA